MERRVFIVLATALAGISALVFLPVSVLHSIPFRIFIILLWAIGLFKLYKYHKVLLGIREGNILKLQKRIDLMPVSQILFDRVDMDSLIVRHLNPAMESLLKTSCQEAELCSASEVWPFSSSVFQEESARIMKHQMPGAFELNFPDMNMFFYAHLWFPDPQNMACMLIEITDLKLAQEAIAETEAIYRQAIACSNGVPYCCNLEDNSFDFIGDLIFKLTEISAAEFSMAKWRSMIQEIYYEDRLLNDPLVKFIENKQSDQISLKYKVLLPDGSIHWFSDCAVIMRDQKGNAVSSFGILHDITSQELSAQKVIRTRDLYQNAIHCAGGVVYRREFNARRYSYMDEKIKDLTGFSVKEFTPELFDDIFVEMKYFGECFDMSHEELMNKMQDGSIKQIQMDFLIHHKNGDMRWLADYSVPIFDEDLQLQATMGILFDVTEAKNAQLALKKSEKIYRQAIQAVNGIPYQKRYSDYRYVFIGDGIEELTGYHPVDFTPDLWKKIILDTTLSGELAGLSFEDAVNAVQSGAVSKWKNDMQILTKDGKKRWISDNAFSLFDDDGHPVGSFGILLDITDRKEVEAALRESEEIYRRAITCSNAVPYEYEYGKNTYRFLGEGICDLTGYSAGELTVEIWDSLIQEIHLLGECGKYDPELSRGLFRGGKLENWQGDYQILTKDGNEKWISEYSVPLKDLTGRVYGSYGLLWDITERKQTEIERHELQKQIQHTQQLRSLGIMAGGIAHDFNNLLMAMLGHADLALLQLRDNQRAFNHVKDIEQNAIKAAELCSQMLAYSGKGRFLMEKVDFNKLIKDIVHFLEDSISDSIDLFWELTPELNDVNVDVTQLRQVVMNLVSNAAESIGDKKGEIRIKTYSEPASSDQLVESWVGEPDSEIEYVYLRITDNGEGISPSILPRIFDPFFSTKFIGRGLGLSAVLGIIRSMNGAIRVHSEPGQGACFEIRIPVSSADIFTVGKSVCNDQMQKRRILLVDDDESVRTVAEKMLSFAKYEVLPAEDGEVATELFRIHHESISCVLLDLSMPKMDGEQTCEELNKISDKVPILICSGYTEDEISKRFEGKNLAGFIQKPYRFQQLVDMLEDIHSS